MPYIGHQFDGITGQYYSRARFYNPVRYYDPSGYNAASKERPFNTYEIPEGGVCGENKSTNMLLIAKGRITILGEQQKDILEIHVYKELV